MDFAYTDEDEAFRRYAEAFPEHTTLLIDTYDTLAAARRIVSENIHCQAIRLDSGDLRALSLKVRAIFDAGGRKLDPQNAPPAIGEIPHRSARAR